MTTTNFSQTAAFIWAVADLLRGDFKQSQYGRIILPFTLLRRLECVLAPTKDAVLKQYEQAKAMNLPEDGFEKLVLRATDQTFFNTSPMDLSKLGQGDIKANLGTYIQSFSKDAREIFEHFRFDEFIGALNEANLLYKVVQKFAHTDLSPQAISNHDMGLVFEELIRRFAESSNETAGEHFTPRDIVRLTTSLVFMEDDEALTKPGIIRTIYDPTAGTGGFLSAGMEYVHELNPQGVMRAFGQELNPESYAICKADMLIKGQDVSRIKLGNTLSNDHLPGQPFDYMLSNPPFGVDWKKIEGDIKDEHTLKGFDGRFGPGLPRVSDGSLLLTVHFTDAAIATLRFAPGAFAAPMQWIYHAYGDDWAGHADDIRVKLKKDFPDLKEKQVKELLDAELWHAQKQLMEKAQRLQAVLGSDECLDFNQWGRDLDKALKTTAIKLDAKERKQLLDAITRKNPRAAAVIKRVVKDAPNPLYGMFGYRGQVVTFEQDSDLRDAENVPLDPRRSVTDLIEEYFQREVAPHVPDAWINADKCDERDGEIGVVGYEIPFNRHFYEYQPPRPLEEIDADLDAVSAEIMELLREVHS